MPAVEVPIRTSHSGYSFLTTSAIAFSTTLRTLGYASVSLLSQYIGDLIPDAHVNGSWGRKNTAFIDNNSFATKELLIDLYDTKLDDYIEKINNFDIDVDKKMSLINILIQDNAFAQFTNLEPQSAKLMELFDYCLDDIKKINLKDLFFLLIITI